MSALLSNRTLLSFTWPSSATPTPGSFSATRAMTENGCSACSQVWRRDPFHSFAVDETQHEEARLATMRKECSTSDM